jgi:hypothetical protein
VTFNFSNLNTLANNAKIKPLLKFLLRQYIRKLPKDAFSQVWLKLAQWLLVMNKLKTLKRRQATDNSWQKNQKK